MKRDELPSEIRSLKSLVADFIDAIKARDWETAEYLADKATEETGHRADVFDREDA